MKHAYLVQWSCYQEAGTAVLAAHQANKSMQDASITTRIFETYVVDPGDGVPVKRVVIVKSDAPPPVPKKPKFKLKLKPRERHMVLAALRLWQHSVRNGGVVEDFIAIAKDNYQSEELTVGEINDLCDRINS